MNDEMMRCLASFISWANDRGWNTDHEVCPSGFIDFEDSRTELIWIGWRSAMEEKNTRAKASAPEGGEAVAWKVVIEGCDPQFVSDPQFFKNLDRANVRYTKEPLFTRSNAKAGEVDFPDNMPFPDDVHSPRYIMDHNFALGFNACRAMWVATHDKTKA